MPIFDHFSILAPFYDRLISVPDTKILEIILGIPDSGILMDAGGGTGRIAQTMTNRYNQVVVVDASIGMLKQAANKDSLSTVCAFSEILPFSDGMFERIIMIDALHHVINQRNTAKELWRVLKPEGRLVIEEPDVTRFPVKIIALAEKLALMRSKFLDPEAIVSLFPRTEARLNIIRDNLSAWVVIDKLSKST